jgi:hypothetical protein
MHQSVTLLRETIHSFQAINEESLRRGSLREIVHAKADCDLMAWFCSFPIDSASHENGILAQLVVKKTCMEMKPCIDAALRSKMLAESTREAQVAYECLVVRYRELERGLRNIIASVDPASMTLLELRVS